MMDKTEILIPPGLDQVFVDICGCGSGQSMSLVLEVLERCAAWVDATTKKPFGEISRHYPGTWIGDSLEREFVVHYLGSYRVGLLEHGSSVNGSWPTERGRVALAWLREHLETIDAKDDETLPPHFVTADGVTMA